MQPSALIDRLARIPRAQRLVLFGGLYVILVVAWWALFYLPNSTERADLAREKGTLLQQKQQVETRVQNKEKYESELNQLTADLKQALKELPNTREIPGLLKGISTLGKKVGLEIRKFEPLPEVPRDYVAEVPVALEVAGGYHEVAMFFDRLSKMNRIVYVRDIEMTNPVERGGKTWLDVTGKVVTFRFLTEKELEAAAKKGKSERRGGRKRKGGRQ